MRLWIDQKRPPNARDWAFGGSLLESNDLQWVGEDIEQRALSFFSPYTPVARKVFLWYYENRNNMIIRFLLVARKGNAYG